MELSGINPGYSQLKPAKTIWGMGKPNESIQILFIYALTTGKADDKGFWQINLPASKIGRNLQMLIRGENDTIKFNYVLAGDVWFASGQSNMEHSVAGWEWIPHSAIDN